jgi:chorismate dehydratase
MGRRYTLGAVPYINAAPLLAMFEQRTELGVTVAYDLPSRLPAMLASGAADAVLVSSHYHLAEPGTVAARTVGIASEGPVESVRLFSRVPWRSVRTLALDPASMTSNALCLALLREVYGVEPESRPREPGLAEMLGDSDAAVLIGDAGMVAEGDGLRVLDLGEAWTKWTGLPFVWALWVGGDGLDGRLAQLLCQARDYGLVPESGPLPALAAGIVRRASAGTGLDEGRVRRYLGTTMRYRLGPAEEAGLAKFAGLCGLPSPGLWREPAGLALA